jgi:hypothetical protein
MIHKKIINTFDDIKAQEDHEQKCLALLTFDHGPFTDINPLIIKILKGLPRYCGMDQRIDDQNVDDLIGKLMGEIRGFGDSISELVKMAKQQKGNPQKIYSLHEQLRILCKTMEEEIHANLLAIYVTKAYSYLRDKSLQKTSD